MITLICELKNIPNIIRFLWYLFRNEPMLVIDKENCIIHKYINNAGSISEYYDKENYVHCLLHCQKWLNDVTHKKGKMIFY